MSDNTATLAAADPYGLFPRRWLKALQAAGASRLAFLVLCDLASYADNVTGKAYPSVTRLQLTWAWRAQGEGCDCGTEVIPGILTVQRRNRRAAAPRGTLERIHLDDASRHAQGRCVPVCAGEA